MRRSCIAGWGILLALMTASAPAADKLVYRIQFERGFSAGQVFAFTFSDSTYESQKVTTPEGDLKHSENLAKLDLAGEMTIVKVNEKGQEAEELLTIKRFVQQSGPGAPGIVAQPETQVRITYEDGKVLFTGVKGELTQEARGSLRQVFTPRSASPVTDDERFGTAANKSVGDTWPVSTKAMTRGGKLLAENVSGTVTLKDVQMRNGVKCAELVTDLRLKDMPVEGGEAKENTLHVVMTHLLPTDPGLPRMAMSVKLTTHTVAEQASSNGGVLQRVSDTERNSATEWKPVVKSP